MTRSMDGSGSVYALPDGRYRYRVTITDGGRRYRIVRPVVNTAQEAEAGLLQARERGTLSPLAAQ